MKPAHKVLLCILDGWGVRQERADNAIALAGTPHLDKLTHGMPHTGLVSPGGVHSSMEHLYGLLKAARERGVAHVYVHAFTDGRDTPPQSGLGYVEELERFLRETHTGKIATVGGQAPDALSAIRASYAEKVTDEFIKPTVTARQWAASEMATW